MRQIIYLQCHPPMVVPSIWIHRQKDGKPFKFYCIQRGGPAAERAEHDKNSMFHELVTGEGVKPYMADNLLFSSKDGLHWALGKGC